IASEQNFKDDKLTALKYDNAGGDAGLPVVVISRQAAAKILELSSAGTLTTIEEATTPWVAKVVEAVSKYDAEHPGSKSQIGYHLLLDPKVRSPRSTLGGDRFYLEVPQYTMLAVTTDIVRKSAPASNVVGVLEGSDPKLKSEVIVVGAHYDHLGRGGEGSLAPREGDIHHGADDNASGVAGLLE